MADKIQSTRIVCEKGLDSTQNYINLSSNKPGCATRLINYEVGLSGGYRRINGYTLYDTTFGEVGVGGVGQGKILGLIIFDNSTSGATEIIAARRDVAGAGANYHFYKYNSGTGWASIATGLTHAYISGGSTVDKLRWAVANDGFKNYLVVVDGVNNAVIYNGTTWAYIDSADTGADFAHAGGNQAVNAPSVVAVFSNTVFLSKDVKNTAEGVVAYSAPNAFYDWTVANGAGQALPGFPVMAIKPFRENLYVFGKNAIKRIIADTTAGFLVKDVTANIGLISTDGIVEIGGDLVFLGPDGFRPVSGTDKIGDVQLETISKPIQTLLTARISGNVGLDVNSVVVKSKSQFRMFFSLSSIDAADSRGIIGGLRLEDQQNGWEFGELLGFRCSVAASQYINGTDVVIHGDYDGKVYRQENGPDLNGAAMLSVYSTPYLDLGDTETRKLFEKANIFMSPEGNVDITLGIDYDWGDINVSTPASYILNVDGSVAMYDSGVDYDTGAVYGGTFQYKVLDNIQGSFFSTRLTFSTSGSTEPHSIHAIILEYQVEGRR